MLKYKNRQNQEGEVDSEEAPTQESVCISAAEGHWALRSYEE